MSSGMHGAGFELDGPPLEHHRDELEALTGAFLHNRAFKFIWNFNVQLDQAELTIRRQTMMRFIGGTVVPESSLEVPDRITDFMEYAGERIDIEGSFNYFSRDLYRSQGEGFKVRATPDGSMHAKTHNFSNDRAAFEMGDEEPPHPDPYGEIGISEFTAGALDKLVTALETTDWKNPDISWEDKLSLYAATADVSHQVLWMNRYARVTEEVREDLVDRLTFFIAQNAIPEAELTREEPVRDLLQNMTHTVSASRAVLGASNLGDGVKQQLALWPKAASGDKKPSILYEMEDGTLLHSDAKLKEGPNGAIPKKVVVRPATALDVIMFTECLGRAA